MTVFKQLALEAEAAFSFLAERGMHVSDRRLLAPESFRGGFTLTFLGAGLEYSIEYLEMQFRVSAAKAEVFGPTVHPEFGGNMFSAEHLRQYLPQLADIVRRYSDQHE
jgi:hypothetical protein